VADQRWRRRCRNRQRCDIRHCSCELQLVKSFAREAEYHRRIRRTIARKLLYRQHYGAHVRARVRTEKRKLRIPEVHQQRSRSPGRFSFLFLSFLSSFFFLIFSLSNGGGSLPSEESRNIAAAYGVSEFRDYGWEFIKFSFDV